MVHCAVFGCSNSQRKKEDANVHFFRFPKDQNLRQEWVSFCNRKDTVNAKTARVCSVHFAPECLMKSMQHKLLEYSPKNRRKLKSDALPTERRPTSMSTTPSKKGSTQCCPKAYRYLRQQCHWPLPGLSTLRKWASSFIINGILHSVLYLMKEKAKTLSEMERLTVLSIDEMFIKDEICLDRSLEQVFGPHKTVQVMMCQGLFSSWKQPVYYNFDAPVNKDVVKQLFECKYIVVAILIDMGPSNMAFWKAKGIDKDHVSFVDPSDPEKLIFLFADVRHLLKLIRNHFLDKGFKLFDEMITKNCVESLLKISQSPELKIAK
ncbi:hypothetical protein Zmor_000869 [Zophobas morio]|uniref:THAP-type domain-containing protein n=1 Tax=Zophobas morio TaxID=2755281 RepID=A0AA38IX73_9CUCU|nr:hypothetical protein Zmor_000869 [Zophobas morio]